MIAREPLGSVPAYPAEYAQRYRAAGYWTDDTFAEFLPQTVLRSGDQTALCGNDHRGDKQEISYRDLDARCAALAAGLHDLGIRDGDRVLVQLPNICEYIEAIFAVFRLGALPVFTLPAHRTREIAHFAEATDAAAYITVDQYAGFDHRSIARDLQTTLPRPPAIIVAGEAEEFISFDDLRSERRQPVADVSAADVAFLQLSGGTTGVSKLIARTHADYLYSVRESAVICELSPATKYLVALPAAHNFPMSSPGILGTLYTGGQVVLAPDPAPSTAFELIEAKRVTMVSLVPPLAQMWVSSSDRASRDLSSLSVAQVGGAKFAADSALAFQDAFECTLQQVFGMAEGLVNYTRLSDDTNVIAQTQGRPISPDDEIRIVDDTSIPVSPGTRGHLLTRGPYTIRGYYNAPDHDAQSFDGEGFYRTGDIVRMTPEGYLVVEGRAKEQINRGGDKFSPVEVEEVLVAHPAVIDAAVVGYPDPLMGEKSCAFVIISTPDATPTLLELKTFVRDKGLADFKIPDRIRFVDEFPATGVGKTDRRGLRSALATYLAEN